MKFYKQKNRGFTLMDILISTAIISLLSSLFLFRVSEAKKKAEDGQMKAESREISNAIALYKNDHNGRAPLVSSSGEGGTEGVLHSEGDENSDYFSTMQALVQQGYLADIPTSPTGVSYAYGVSDDLTEAVFSAYLNNPASGSNSNTCSVVTEDDIEVPAVEGGYMWVPGEEVCEFDEFGIEQCYSNPGQWVFQSNSPSVQIAKCDGSSNFDYCQCI